MDLTVKIFVSLLLLELAVVTLSQDDYGECERVVMKWKSNAFDVDVKEDKHILKELLFFLHVPRTGGRTYFYCFLKKLYPNTLECPRSYDKLRFDPRKPNCRLLGTHDDYSMMTKLPKRKTSVVTILRNPIDRVFSTYEFSIEVAARFLIHPNLTSATQMASRIRKKANAISTLDIWPWKYLVPWMREDLFARREIRRSNEQNITRSNDSYNMEDMAMPLLEYIKDPIAHDIIHNGATFQVAGLTNNSYYAESHQVRHCVQKYHNLGMHVLEVAKKRLDDMLYVGLTEDHKESATMFGNVVGSQVISQLMGKTDEEPPANKKSGQNSDNSEFMPSSVHLNSSAESTATSANVDGQNMTVSKLMQSYETCIQSLRKTQAGRRTTSLKKISPVNFSKEARRQVPEAVTRQIEQLNSLDLELYKHAKKLFAKQHEQMSQKINIPARTSPLDTQTSAFYVPTDALSLEVLFIAVISLAILASILVYINVRRTSKVKI